MTCNIGFSCKLFNDPKADMHACLLRNATKNNLITISEKNILALEYMVDYAMDMKIHLMRIGSDVIPFASHQDVNFDWKSMFSSKLEKLGRKIKENKLRVTMHPGQYTVLNSPNEDTVKKAILDLNWHADFLNSLGTDYTSKIILHIGGVYKNKTPAISRFIENFQMLPENVKKRIILENDERNYNIKDVLDICSKLRVPAVFDILHHKILPPDNVDFLYWIKKCSYTWSHDDGKQKIHYSQQLPGAKIGAHSETINVLEFADFYNQISDLQLDIMLEVKDKNISAIKCCEYLSTLPKQD